MKLQLFTISNKILFFFIGLLGFSTACSKKSDERYYGTPYAKVIIYGKTESSDSKKPVRNIEVIYNTIKTNQQGQFLDTLVLDTTYTDKKGLFFRVFEYNLYNTYLINVRDIDSTENGSFKAEDTNIILTKKDFKGGDGQWNMGTAIKNIYIQLDPKP